jgi:putative heme iron utilization protein
MTRRRTRLLLAREDERESERESERARERARDRERERDCSCLAVLARYRRFLQTKNRSKTKSGKQIVYILK